jgi:hypothetical protein
MVLLGEQYEQTIAEMLQKQSVGHQAGMFVLMLSHKYVHCVQI